MLIISLIKAFEIVEIVGLWRRHAVTKGIVTFKSHPSSVAVSLSGKQHSLAPYACSYCHPNGLGLGVRGQIHSVNKGATYWCKGLQILNTEAAVLEEVTEQQLHFCCGPQACILTSQSRHRVWKSLTDKQLQTSSCFLTQFTCIYHVRYPKNSQEFSLSI